MISEKKIGDVFKVTSGGTPSRKKQEYFKNGTIPWVKTGDLKGKYANEPKEYITELALANSSAKIFPKNTVLLAMYGATIGACSILKIAAATNQACGAILPSEKCDHVYLYYYLKSINKELISKGVGGAQPNISGGIIKSTKIPLPPLDQQKKIAAILDAADAYRQKTKALITKYEELSQSLFLDMFGDPRLNEQNFEQNNLNEYLELITYGLTVRPEYIDNGIRLISAREIRSGKLDLTSGPQISESDYNKLSAKGKPNRNEILFSKTGSIGHSAIIDTDVKFAITQNAARLVFKVNVNPVFALEQLRTSYFQSLCQQRAKGNAVKDLQLGDMKKLPFISPPIKLQNKFADSIQTIETQKAQAQASLAQAEELFNSLLQRAFKGELV